MTPTEEKPWGASSEEDAWNWPSQDRPPVPAPDPRDRRRRRAGHIAIILGGLLCALQGIRLGIVTSSYSAVSAVLIGGGVSIVTIGLVAWAQHRARLKGIITPRLRTFRAMQWGAVTGGLVIAVAFTVVGREFAVTVVNQELAVPGSPGYTTFTGPHGKPMAVGSPWGRPCQPIVFVVASDVPYAVYDQVEIVVGQARADGLDVTLDNRLFYWQPAQLYPPGLTNGDVKFVHVLANNTSTPTLSNGLPEHIDLGWDARLSANGKNEVLTSLVGTLYLRNFDGGVLPYRRAMRQLIAFSQGIGASTASGSGISDGSTADSFSQSDLIAMQRMSGCHLTSAG